MPDWTSFVSIGLGILNVIQWIQQQVGLGKFDCRNQQLESLKASLEQLNAMCNDAEGKGEAAKPDAMARFISDVAHAAKMMEHSADIMLGNLRLTPVKPRSHLRRFLGWVFPITRI